jgi:hypothetical protein
LIKESLGLLRFICLLLRSSPEDNWRLVPLWTDLLISSPVYFDWLRMMILYWVISPAT